MAETGVALGADDAPLTPLLTWDAARPLDARLDDVDPGELFARTGVRLSPKVPLATWAWLASTRPEVHRAMRRWAGAADLVVHALTGRLVTDHTLAGRSGAHHLDCERWDDDLLGLVGLRPGVLPEVLPPDEVAGTADGVPVVVAGHDHQVGAHVAGVRRPGDVANSLGTSEVVLRVLRDRPDPAAVHAAGMSLVRTVAGHERALLAGSASAGAAYAAWTAGHGLDPDLVPADRPPTGAFVLPYLRGRQCPDPDPDARLRLVGDLHDATGDVLLRALLEGLSLHTRWMHDAQRDLDPAAPVRPMVLLGGAGARNAAWTRVKAEVLPVQLRAVAEHEPVAVGAAVVAAERAGLLDPGAVTLPADPVPAPAADRYAETYQQFVREARRGEGDR